MRSRNVPSNGHRVTRPPFCSAINTWGCAPLRPRLRYGSLPASEETRGLNHHPITPSPHHPITHHPITPSPHHPITPSPHHPITPSPHHPITPSPHHPFTGMVGGEDFDRAVFGHIELDQVG